MNRKWSDDLSTGYKHIDEHHEELFQLTCLLDAAIQSCRASKLEDVIKFLEEYVTEHFSEEEELMISKNFKYYQAHKDEHLHFSKWVHHIRQSFDEDRSRTHLIFELRKLIDDLVRHIRTIDVLLGELKKESI